MLLLTFLLHILRLQIQMLAQQWAILAEAKKHLIKLFFLVLTDSEVLLWVL
jgi:hypothetical protein